MDAGVCHNQAAAKELVDGPGDFDLNEKPVTQHVVLYGAGGKTGE